MMQYEGFYKFILPLEGNLFDELSTSVDFEAITNGRKGNHLVAPDARGIPIVRTTTKYNKPAHHFGAIHNKIVDSINDIAGKYTEKPFPPLAFNNALIEIYERSYFKMKYHSDQCLDIEDDSYIALFSCYELPDDADNFTRTLRVKNKETNEEFEFSLENNSVILFSLSTNTQFQHKIILDNAANQKITVPDNRWLGITFRKSATYIQFRENTPYLSDDSPLTLANEAQQKEFYTLRGQENRSMNYAYPEISYTLSMGDILKPKG